MSDDLGRSHSAQNGQTKIGFIYAFCAFSFWGFVPIYMKAVAHFGAVEVLAHRIIWSIPVALLVLVITRRTGDIIRVIKSPNLLAAITLSAIIISVNWGLYVWAVNADRIIEAALGYYINPLISVALGMVFLGEKMDKLQASAIALAILAVSIMTYAVGQIPWVALVLACSFAAYGFIRKTVDIGPTQGFMMEVLILAIVAVPFVVYLGYRGSGHLGLSTNDTLLVLGCGPITAIPLILFSYGAKRLRLSTVGLMQYIAPTLIFLIGVFVYHEPFNQWQLFAFALIWTAIALYSWSSIKQLMKPLAVG